MLSLFSSPALRSSAVSKTRISSPSTSISKPTTSSLSPFTRTTVLNGALQHVRAIHLSAMLAAVPKKKQSYSRVRVRSHSPNKAIKMADWQHRQACSHCKRTILSHNVCHHCGWYKGVPIYLRAVRRHKKSLAVKAKLQAEALDTQTTSQATANP